MSAFEKNVSCKDVAPLLVFYACDEVSDRERKQIEAHVANCEGCAAQLAEENILQEAMVAAPQPADELDSSGILLSQCRSELAETLDDLSAPPIRNTGVPWGGCAGGWRCVPPGAAHSWSSSGSWLDSGSSVAAERQKRQRQRSGHERHGQAADLERSTG